MKHLLVEGPSRIGKSTLLRGALAAFPGRMAGFLVQRVFGPGDAAGFRLVPLDAPPVSRQFDKATLFLYGSGDAWVRDDRLFAEQFLLLLEAAESCDLVYMDEIGGPELCDQRVYERLCELFSKTTRILGTIKCEENCAALKDAASKQPAYRERYREFRTFLASRASILRMRRGEGGRIEEEARRYLRGVENAWNQQ